MNHKIAFTFITLVQVLFWVDFEYVVTHLESYGFYFLRYFFTWFLNMAKSFIGFAIKIRKSSSPFTSDLLKYIWWYRKL